MSDGVTVQHLLRERVAEEVRALMARKQMTGADLAVAIGRSPMYVSRRVRAEVAFDLDDLERMAQVFGVPVNRIMPPPEVTAGAAGRQDIPRYLEMAVFGAAQDRPRDNRPPARSGVGSPDRGVRTAYLGRGPRGRRD